MPTTTVSTAERTLILRYQEDAEDGIRLLSALDDEGREISQTLTDEEYDDLCDDCWTHLQAKAKDENAYYAWEAFAD